MAGINNYENLPGMPIEFKDGGSVLRSNNDAASTKSLLILGTAEDGPVLEPVAVDINTVKLFGKASKGNSIPNGSTLVKDFEHAWSVGCRDIRLMRVTGSPAYTVLETESKTVVEPQKIEEEKGIVGGNEITTFELVHTPISGSERVYCKGTLLTSGYTLSNKTITINKNTCDAGALITVTYSYYPIVKKNESPTVTEKKVTLSQTPIDDETLVVKSNAVALAKETDYTVAGKVITIVKAGIEDGESVDVSYTYKETKESSITENSNSDGSYLTKYTNKIITLSNTPLKNSVRLYIANTEVSNTDAYSIGEDGVTITIDKKYFVRTSDIVVSYIYEKEVDSVNSLRIETINGGEIYNQAKVIVEDVTLEEGYQEKIIKLIKPESKKNSSTEAPLEFKSSNYPTFGAMANAINSHRNNTVFKAFTDFPDTFVMDLTPKDAFLTGGDNGLNCTPQQLYDALAGTRDKDGYIEKQGAYQILENYVCDFIVPGGVYADDYIAGRNKDFAYELALLCAIVTNRTKAMLGAIPMRPCNDTSLLGVQKHVNKLLDKDNVYPLRDENGNLILDSEGKAMDIGRYIHVCVGPETLTLNSELGVIIGNPAVQFAAELSALPAQSSPLNKNLHGIKGLRYNYQTGQLDKLLGARYIVFNTKSNKTGAKSYKMVDGITAAFVGSEYARTTTLRCLQEVIDEFRDAAEPFFGEPPRTENRNALAAAISKKKDKLINEGVAEDIAFQLIVTPQDYLLGEATLEVDIVPPKEFRKINMVVGLKNTI